MDVKTDIPFRDLTTDELEHLQFQASVELRARETSRRSPKTHYTGPVETLRRGAADLIHDYITSKHQDCPCREGVTCRTPSCRRLKPKHKDHV